MPTLEEIRATFAADRFATEAAGCEIRLAEPGHAICAMTLHPHHLNAAGTPQGGAIFTVADFAFAVAVNAFAEQVTVSLQHGITFLAPARGKEIVAEARCVRSGRSTCFYTVTISDELGTAVAHMTVNGFVTQQKDALISARGNSCPALWAVKGGAAVSTPVSTLPQSEFCFFRFFALTLAGNIDKVL